MRGISAGRSSKTPPSVPPSPVLRPLAPAERWPDSPEEPPPPSPAPAASASSPPPATPAPPPPPPPSSPAPSPSRVAAGARALLVVLLTLVWYGSSAGMVLLNRSVFRDGGARVISPLLVTGGHMLLKAVLGVLVLLAASGGCAGARARLANQRLDRATLSYTLLPLGWLTASDVVLSNYALSSVDVATYTVVKSSALAWTFALSLVSGYAAPTPALVAAVAALLAGVGLATYRPAPPPPAAPAGGEGGGDAAAAAAAAAAASAAAADAATAAAWGVACAAGAAACSGGRWVLTQRYLRRPGVPGDSLALLAMVGPATVSAMVGPLLWEARGVLAAAAAWTPENERAVATVVFGGGALAYALVLAEFALVALTSALSLNVIGHAKDAVVIALGVVVFRETLPPAGWVGVALALAGSVAYARVADAALRPPAGAGVAEGAAAAAAAAIRGGGANGDATSSSSGGASAGAAPDAVAVGVAVARATPPAPPPPATPSRTRSSARANALRSLRGALGAAGAAIGAALRGRAGGGGAAAGGGEPGERFAGGKRSSGAAARAAAARARARALNVDDVDTTTYGRSGGAGGAAGPRRAVSAASLDDEDEEDEAEVAGLLVGATASGLRSPAGAGAAAGERAGLLDITPDVARGLRGHSSARATD